MNISGSGVVPPPAPDPENIANGGVSLLGGEKRLGQVKGLAILASNAQAARRSVLGDKSNVTTSVPQLFIILLY